MQTVHVRFVGERDGDDNDDCLHHVMMARISIVLAVVLII